MEQAKKKKREENKKTKKKKKGAEYWLEEAEGGDVNAQYEVRLDFSRSRMYHYTLALTSMRSTRYHTRRPQCHVPCLTCHV